MARKSAILPFICLLFIQLSLINCGNGSAKGNGSIAKQAPKDFTLPPSNTLGVLTYKEGATPGYVLFSIHEDTFLIDYCGRVLKHWKSEHELGGYFELLEDGSLLRSGKIANDSIDYPGIGGIIEKFDWDGNLRWSYKYSSPQFSQHHGMRQLPDGNIIFNAVVRKSRAEALAAGRDPDLLKDEELYDEQLIEIDPQAKDGAKVVWKWRAWDHLIQEYDPQKENYGGVAGNPHRININFMGISNGAKDWLHFNSIAYNEDLDQILIGSQKLSEIYIIDHSTTTREAATDKGGKSGMGGDILYRWGNPESYNSGDASTRTLYSPHFAHWLPPVQGTEDRILIYNNGLGRKPGYSSVDCFSPPRKDGFTYEYSDKKRFGPEGPGWTYMNTKDTTAFYSKIMSSAQRLPNNHIFVCEGTKGRLFEIDQNGAILWEYINPETTNGKILKQGDTPSSHVFMALHYNRDHSAFNNRQLIPSAPIEINFDIGDCP